MRLYSFGNNKNSLAQEQQQPSTPKASAKNNNPAAWSGLPSEEDLYWGESNNDQTAFEDKHYSQWTPADEERLRRAAQPLVAQRIAASQVLDPVKEAAVTKLSREEISTGRVVGRGAFGIVHLVEEIHLRPSHSELEQQQQLNQQLAFVNPQDDTHHTSSMEQQQVDRRRYFRSRQSATISQQQAQQDGIDRAGVPFSFSHDRSYMASNYRLRNHPHNMSNRSLTTSQHAQPSIHAQDNTYRYVIKTVNPYAAYDALNPAQFYTRSVADLVVEAKYLSVLQHENIITLRATSSTSYWNDPQFFIVLDRISETLATRINTRWKALYQKFKAASRLNKVLCWRKKSTDKHDFFIERLRVASELANALAYLHSKRIVYRDLKPQNLGFCNVSSSEKEVVKLFDFGWATELPPSHNNSRNTTSSTWLSPDPMYCGSMRYMAPELGLGEAYNEKVDVYSFSMILWQILAVQKTPMSMYAERDQYWKRVVLGGVRPKIPQKWPTTLHTILSRGWTKQISKRPSMELIAHQLCDLIFEEMGWNEDSGPQGIMKEANWAANEHEIIREEEGERPSLVNVGASAPDLLGASSPPQRPDTSRYLLSSMSWHAPASEPLYTHQHEPQSPITEENNAKHEDNDVRPWPMTGSQQQPQEQYGDDPLVILDDTSSCAASSLPSLPQQPQQQQQQVIFYQPYSQHQASDPFQQSTSIPAVPEIVAQTDLKQFEA